MKAVAQLTGGGEVCSGNWGGKILKAVAQLTGGEVWLVASTLTVVGVCPMHNDLTVVGVCPMHVVGVHP